LKAGGRAGKGRVSMTESMGPVLHRRARVASLGRVD
jgi:hypothetical protein